ncbi:MAG: hypothetical protein R2755_31275 [Acidimicrobiales bacterium]
MSDNPRIDPLYEDGPVFGAKRQALLARCDELARTIAEHDRELERIVKDRRAAAQELRAHRRRLFRRLPWPGRQPAIDGSVQLPPIPQHATWLTGRRLRVICLAILHRFGPLDLPTLHAVLHRLQFAVASRHAVKALADACGHEHDVGRLLRVARGRYRALTAPPRRPLWHGGPRADDLFSGLDWHPGASS